MPEPKKIKLPKPVRWFLAGVFAVLPLVITVIIIAWAGGMLKQLLGPNTLLGKAIGRLGLSFVSNDTIAYLLGIVMVLAAIFVIGILVESGARSLWQRLIDALLTRIPIVSNIYGTSKQLVSMLDKKEGADLKGMSTVFCLFGGTTGGGVLALLVSSDKYTIHGIEYQIVIIPTAPVPIGGWMLFVPANLVHPANLSVEAVMSIYVSMGISAPQYLTAKKP